MEYRVDHHFALTASTPIGITVQRNSVWLSTSTYETDFTIEFLPEHVKILRSIADKLENLAPEYLAQAKEFIKGHERDLQKIAELESELSEKE